MRGRPARLLAVLATLLALGIVVVACGDDDDGDEGAQQPAQTSQESTAASGSYVGRVTGTNAYIALVADGGKLSGYVCDSKKVSVWLTSERVEGDTAELESRQGDPLGDVSFAGETADGRVEVAGRERAFTLERASGEAGLYRAAKVRKKDGKLGEGEVEVGWVLLADGSQRGGTNFIDPITTDNVTKAAPFVDPQTDINVSVNTSAGNAIKLAQRRVQGFINPNVDL